LEKASDEDEDSSQILTLPPVLWTVSIQAKNNNGYYPKNESPTLVTGN
jgi:hypothetical protein